jgi:prepilin-type N-terminal cleavage/methylation domain-containing protein
MTPQGQDGRRRSNLLPCRVAGTPRTGRGLSGPRACPGWGRAFTLIEILTVVMIIGLLVAILLPSLGRGLELGRRTNCKASIKQVVQACMAYAREPITQPCLVLPAASFAAGNWSKASGNPSCLWPLVTNNYCSPQTFLCPSVDGLQPASSGGTGFGNNFGYSYQSMLAAGGGIRTYNTQNTPMNMVIFGDQNPRNISSAGAHDNSASHGAVRGKNEGQNFGSLDGHVIWTNISRVGTSDWIYEGNGVGAGDSSGIAGDKYDVYLIP